MSDNKIMEQASNAIINGLRETIDELSYENDEINRKWAEDNERNGDILSEQQEQIIRLEEENKQLKLEVLMSREASEIYEKECDEWRKIDGADGLIQDLFYDGYHTTKLCCSINTEVDEVCKAITEMKNKIDELKEQIPQKPGKKLSNRDKLVLSYLRDMLDVFNKEDKEKEEGDDMNGEWCNDETLALLARLIK